jgi:uncharacterized protein YceH (UPF0502 family)
MANNEAPIDTRMPNERIADLERKVQALDEMVAYLTRQIEVLRTTSEN